MGNLKPMVAAFDLFSLFDIRVGRVMSADSTTGLRTPSVDLRIDIGMHEPLRSIGQFSLVDPKELVGGLVVVCRNLGAKRVGSYTSEALVLGTPHPDSPSGQHQALPLSAHIRARPGDEAF